MSIQEPSSPRPEAIQTLRTQLTRDLRDYLRGDVYAAGYIVAWLGRRLELEQLEELVDELEDIGIQRAAPIRCATPAT